MLKCFTHLIKNGVSSGVRKHALYPVRLLETSINAMPVHRDASSNDFISHEDFNGQVRLFLHSPTQDFSSKGAVCYDRHTQQTCKSSYLIYLYMTSIRAPKDIRAPLCYDKLPTIYFRCSQDSSTNISCTLLHLECLEFHTDIEKSFGFKASLNLIHPSSQVQQCLQNRLQGKAERQSAPLTL